MANTIGEKELKTNWPFISGLGTDERHDGRQANLVAEEINLVPKREMAGL